MARRRERLRAIAMALQGTVESWHLLRGATNTEAAAYRRWRHERQAAGLPHTMELFAQHIAVCRRLVGPAAPPPPRNGTIRK